MEIIIISVGTVAAVLAAVFAMSNWNRTRRHEECAVGPWLVALALVVPLAGCSTECEREAAKTCKAGQAAIFVTCVKRATAKACIAAEAAAFDFGTFDTCVRNEVSRCRGGR